MYFFAVGQQLRGKICGKNFRDENICVYLQSKSINRIMTEETNTENLRYTEEELKAAILKKKEKNASFFFALAQLVFTAFVIGGLAIYFTDFVLSWRVAVTFVCGIVMVCAFYWLANTFLTIKR